MDFQEQLEHLDNNNGEKSQYMELILSILHDNWVSKEESDIIENAIYSYESAR